MPPKNHSHCHRMHLHQLIHFVQVLLQWQHCVLVVPTGEVIDLVARDCSLIPEAVKTENKISQEMNDYQESTHSSYQKDDDSLLTYLGRRLVFRSFQGFYAFSLKEYVWFLEFNSSPADMFITSKQIF